MLGVRQRPSNCGRVTGKLVRDHDTWLGAALTVKDTAQETLGGYLIAPFLDQDVQDDAVLVNGSPQPVAFATDLQGNFVEMPLVAGSHASSTQPGRLRASELGAPLADGLVADEAHITAVIGAPSSTASTGASTHTGVVGWLTPGTGSARPPHARSRAAEATVVRRLAGSAGRALRTVHAVR
jgi:hypothetical protein